MLLKSQAALRQVIQLIKAPNCHGLEAMLLPHLGGLELERHFRLVHVTVMSQAPNDKTGSTEGRFSLCSQLSMFFRLVSPSL